MRCAANEGGARGFAGAVVLDSGVAVVRVSEAVGDLGSEITMVPGSEDAVVSAVAEVEIMIGLKKESETEEKSEMKEKSEMREKSEHHSEESSEM